MILLCRIALILSPAPFLKNPCILLYLFTYFIYFLIYLFLGGVGGGEGGHTIENEGGKVAPVSVNVLRFSTLQLPRPAPPFFPQNPGFTPGIGEISRTEFISRIKHIRA